MLREGKLGPYQLMDGWTGMLGALVVIYYGVFCMHSAGDNYDGLSPLTTAEWEPEVQVEK